MSLDKDNRKVKIISAIALVVALLAPVGMKLVAHPYDEFAAHLSGVLWTVLLGQLFQYKKEEVWSHQQ